MTHQGFSISVPSLRTQIPLIPRCGLCGLYKNCHSPKMPVDGAGEKGILIVGAYPGQDEDIQGSPFVGATGRQFRDMLLPLGVNLRRDCWLYNALICHSKKYPKKAIDYCRPNVVKVIEDLKPKKIILLGGEAIKSVISWLWKEDKGGVERWVGQKIPLRRLNAWICPTYHPAAIGHVKDDPTKQLIENRIVKHLESFIALEDRPYGTVPIDLSRMVECLYTQIEAADAIKGFIDKGAPIAFDLECNMLKPDSRDAEIYCCSVSDGDTTISFPWYGAAITLMELLIRSEVPKIGWNCKYEDRWCRKEFGCGVNNWMYDGMLLAHLLDNRAGTKSLKFQAFVKLGLDSYNDYVEPYLKAEGSNVKNRIKEAELSKVLLYNGMDSFITLMVVREQLKELGISL